MAHIAVIFARQDQAFAHQLAVQLQQRGLVVAPVPDPAIVPVAEAAAPSHADSAAPDATHLICVLSPDALSDPDLLAHCEAALAARKTLIGLLVRDAELPPRLETCPVVDFRGPFLLAVEALVKRLRAAKAPTRQLTVEHPPPIARPGLLPLALPPERCWREDRLRINYNLPILMTQEELELRLPAFFERARFELVKSTRKEIRGWRMREFRWFDPRRADHTITVQRRKGGLRVYYRMTRLQVYHWFPAHYHVLNREAAALYRYLVTGRLEPDALLPVQRQAQRAMLTSWGTIVGVLMALVVVILLLAL